jgi:putative Mg2+ transporter-C (MgtC) family protein
MQIAIDVCLALCEITVGTTAAKTFMPLEINWQEIAIRLLCTVFAGAVIGLNREGHGRTAGLRTTILLCLSASLAMILANLMIDTTGKTPASFVQLDMMRLPLGILTGMGFIGAGAILRRDNLVVGVTTAATLWFVSVMGLCFGAGQFGLGFAALGIGFFTLSGLKWLERHLELQRNATLTIVVGQAKVTESEIAKPFIDAGYKINFSSVTYDAAGNLSQISGNVHWRGATGFNRSPEFLKQLLDRYHFEKMEWQMIGEV